MLVKSKEKSATGEIILKEGDEIVLKSYTKRTTIALVPK